MLLYRKKRENNIEIKIDYLSNNSSNLVASVEITNELDAYLKQEVENTNTINIKNINVV